MMQEVGNDSNGEGAYDFVSDAKKDSPPLAPLTSTSAPSAIPPSVSSAFTSSPLLPPSGVSQNTLPTGQKPSYAYPPGFQASSASSPRAPPLRPPGAGAPPLGPPGLFRPPSGSPNTFPPPSNYQPGTTPALSDNLTDISNILKATTLSSARQSGQGSQGGAPGGASGAQPDLNEIFGTDLMAQLPPLQPHKPPLATVAPPPPSLATVAPPPSSLATMAPPPPTFPGVSTAAGGVNPFSSQAAAGHLPSFSALPPLPALGQPQLASERVQLPSVSSYGPPGSAPPPVAMMSVPSTGPSLPGPSIGPAFPSPQGQFDTAQQYQLPPSTGPAQVPPYGQQQHADSVSYEYGAPPAYGTPYQGGQGGYHTHGDQGGQGGQGGHGGNRSWWVQSSFDALKNVTEKAKSTAFSLMTTLDPQMKQFGGVGASGVADPAASVVGELTLFYIGNETNLMEAVKAGVESCYKSAHVYARSGTASGHKQQIGFVNALKVASATIALAQSAPQMQNSLLLAIEPFVVELSHGFWYVGTCLVLSDPLTARGDLLHTFSQLTLICDFGMKLAGPNDEQLIAPLDDLIAERSALMLRRESWMEQLTGVAWSAIVAFSLRQLIGMYKRRHSHLT